MNLIQQYFQAFQNFSNNNAFCLGNEMLSYSQFLSLVNGSRKLLESQSGFVPQNAVGVLCNERAETYAAVFAIWFSGGIFVPLNPSSPALLNNELIQKHKIKIIFASKDIPEGMEPQLKILNNKVVSSPDSLPLYKWKSRQVMYVLNTSGSTGTPKNVPVNLKNLTAFVEGFLELYPELSSADNFLQTYELTADAAFTGYLIPFLKGATVYSVLSGQFKPFAVAKILTEKPITWVQVTPSLLACLHPFFDSFNLKVIEHFHFGGEALPANMVEEWREYVPNAEISNVYGPTETTVTATIYKCLPGEKLKAINNIVSIGKPLKSVFVKVTENGELLIAGDQVMENYLFTYDQPFKNLPDENQDYYPTGDLVEKDDDGFLYYHGRLDEQVKINGYRVDLIEVENKVRLLVADARNVAAVSVEKSSGIHQLVVFIENYSGNGNEITEKLKSIFPVYKIPEKIIGVSQFPLAPSGKTDKKALVTQFKNSPE